MNNEPVAWINRHMDAGWLSWDKDSNADSSTPLYLHPAKTLTDEIELLETEIFVKDAIIKCYKEALEQIATGELTNEPNNYKDTVYVMRQIALNALAILRKAQE